MESFQEWTKLQFQIGIIRNEDKLILVNTGFPDDVTAISKAWKDYLGDRAILQRPDSSKMTSILKNENINPDDVTHVVITPVQLYATGNLHFLKMQKFAYRVKAGSRISLHQPIHIMFPGKDAYRTSTCNG
jgi:glyoxylase-like metal-dependent hydrolase (beta-lactamase superfamily II)